MENESTDTIKITIDASNVDFDNVRKNADEIAKKMLSEPFLIAWYDGINDKGHPDVQECTDKPGWQTYAESRGGKLTINVNDGKFILVYSETSLKDT